MIQRFSQTTIENLGCYVYALVNPITQEIFYIGKGTGDRVFQHEREDGGKEKYSIMEEIKMAGLEVGKLIIRRGLTEDQALHVEAAFLDLWPYQNAGKRLANIQGGRQSLDHGMLTVDEAEAFYAVEKMEKDEFRHNAVIININRSYLKEGNIYDAVRGNWAVSAKGLERFPIAIAEYRGVFRAVFKIRNWQATAEISKRGKPRMRFTGLDVSHEPEYQIYMRKLNGFKRHGQANPVQFVIAGGQSG
jgi:hypothetical protein